jgi:sugar transferase EpsL
MMVKRTCDIVGAAVVLILMTPVMILTGLLILVFMGRPVFFRQERPGLHGEPFTLHKFRTMKDERDAEGRPLGDELRLTRLGRVLRSSSIDELPTLLNVLKGEMSLVGPRPLLTEYLPLYDVEQSRRHEVKPGITGLAQVMGRNAIPWERKFELDVWYVEHRTLALDMRILFKTLANVFKREGINQEGHATVERYRGGF